MARGRSNSSKNSRKNRAAAKSPPMAKPGESKVGRSRDAGQHETTRSADGTDKVAEASEESFPASDPPAWIKHTA